MSKTTLTAENLTHIRINDTACIFALRIMSISLDGPLATHIDDIKEITICKNIDGWWGSARTGRVTISLPGFKDPEIAMALATLAAAQK